MHYSDSVAVKRPINIRHLRYFLAVAEAGSFCEAARRLGLSQPAIWQQMRQLENYIGISLLSRGGKSTGLTPAGLIFLKRARDIVHRFDDLFRRLGRESGRVEVPARVRAPRVQAL